VPKHAASCTPALPACARIAAATASTAPAVPARVLFSASLTVRCISARHAATCTLALSSHPRNTATTDSTSAAASIALSPSSHCRRSPRFALPVADSPDIVGLVQVGSYPQPACPSNPAAQQEHPGHAPPLEGSQLGAALGTGRVVCECWMAADQRPTVPSRSTNASEQ